MFSPIVELSRLFPKQLILGLEIRVKVSDYVQDRIHSLRAAEPGSYQNIACLRSNAMKYLPNFFTKGQVSSLGNPYITYATGAWYVFSVLLCVFNAQLL